MNLTAHLNQNTQPEKKAPNRPKIGACLELLERIGRQQNPAFKIDKTARPFYVNLINYFSGAAFVCNNWQNNKEEAGRTNKGLYICGPIGTGKTTALNTLRLFCLGLRRLTGFKLHNCLRVEEAFNTGGFNSLLRYEAGPAAFDDLGAEEEKAVFYGSACNVMQRIIQNRYINFNRKGTKTHFTSNFNLEMFGGRYGARASSRLVEMCNKIYLPGEDRRK